MVGNGELMVADQRRVEPSPEQIRWLVVNRESAVQAESLQPPRRNADPDGRLGKRPHPRGGMGVITVNERPVKIEQDDGKTVAGGERTVHASGFWVLCSCSGSVRSCGFRVLSSGFGVRGSGFRVRGFGGTRNREPRTANPEPNLNTNRESENPEG